MFLDTDKIFTNFPITSTILSTRPSLAPGHFSFLWQNL